MRDEFRPMGTHKKSLSDRIHCTLLRFEMLARQAGLADDRLQCADADLGMQGHRHCYRCIRRSFLHDDVAATLSHFDKTVLGQQ